MHVDNTIIPRDDFAALSRWDRLYSHCSDDTISQDLWLLSFEETIQNCHTPIVDLGCGSGVDTKWLMKRGKQVIACDYSAKAIEHIRSAIPEIYKTMCFDMSKELPLEDHSAQLLIADLSLHYFTEEITRFVLNEIRRVLTRDGSMLLRVNSIKDVNYGAGEGTELESNYFRTKDGRFKRFFNREDIDRFFSDWHILHLSEDQTHRFGLPKELWTLHVTPKANL